MLYHYRGIIGNGGPCSALYRNTLTVVLLMACMCCRSSKRWTLLSKSEESRCTDVPCGSSAPNSEYSLWCWREVCGIACTAEAPVTPPLGSWVVVSHPALSSGSASSSWSGLSTHSSLLLMSPSFLVHPSWRFTCKGFLPSSPPLVKLTLIFWVVGLYCLCETHMSRKTRASTLWLKLLGNVSLTCLKQQLTCWFIATINTLLLWQMLHTFPKLDKTINQCALYVGYVKLILEKRYCFLFLELDKICSYWKVEQHCRAHQRK